MASGTIPTRPDIRTITFTTNTDYVSLDSGSCYISGNVVTLNVRLKTKVSISGSVIFLSGLPKPLSHVKFAMNKYNSNGTPAYISATNGNLVSDYGSMSSNQDLFVNVAYMTNE